MKDIVWAFKTFGFVVGITFAWESLLRFLRRGTSMYKKAMLEEYSGHPPDTACTVCGECKYCKYCTCK